MDHPTDCAFPSVNPLFSIDRLTVASLQRSSPITAMAGLRWTLTTLSFYQCKGSLPRHGTCSMFGIVKSWNVFCQLPIH